MQFLPLSSALYPEFTNKDAGKAPLGAWRKLHGAFVGNERRIGPDWNHSKSPQGVAKDIFFGQFVKHLSFGALAFAIHFDSVILLVPQLGIGFPVLILYRLPFGLNF